jgi:hypothetical protein
MENKISGKLLNEWNRGISEIFVKLSQITGPGKTQPLLAGKTDCNGEFSLVYPALPTKEFCGVAIFELVFRKNAKSALNEVRYELTDQQLLSPILANAQQKIWEGSEWNWYSAVISGLVAETDLEHKDTIGWLHKKTGIRIPHLEAWIKAKKMCVAMNIPAHYLYAFLRMGIQLEDKNELANRSLTELEEVLVKSVENFIINDYKTDWGAFVKIHTAIKQQSDQTKVQETLTKPFAFETPLKDLLQVASLSVIEQNKIGTYLTQKEFSINFWQDLEKELGLTLAKVEKVKETLLIHDVLRGNHGLTKTLITTGSKAMASYSSAQWIKLMTTQKSFIEQFPGNTSTEKRDYYLNSIYVKLEQTHPMPFFVARLAENKSFPNQSKVLTFLTKNPTFEFGKQSVKKYIAKNKQALKDIAVADQNALISTLILTQVQYLAALPGENFKAVNILQSMKFNSMTAILDQGSAFLPAYTALGGSEKGAETLIDSVKTIADYMVQSQAGLQDLKNLPLVLQNETAKDLAADPELKNLFGSQDNCDCQHCRSIYSPAAYLADALHFLEKEHLLAPIPGIRPAGSKSLYELLTNNNRRPDIKKLLLNCENANTPLPYIDLVNEVLLNAINGANEIAIDTTRTAEELAAYPEFTNKEASDEVLTILKNAIFPFNLPFDYHQRVAKAWWNHLGTSPIEIHTIVQPNENALSLLCQKQFGFSKVEWKLITGYNKEIDAEGRTIVIPEVNLWGGTLPKSGKGNVTDWLDKTGLTLEEFTEVVDTQFVQTANAPQIFYFIEQADGINKKICSLEDAEFAWYSSTNGRKPKRRDIDEVQRERIYKFIRLWKKLNWKIEEVDTLIKNVFNGIVDNDSLSQLYFVVKLAHKWKASPQDLLPIWNKQTSEFLDERSLFYQLADLNEYQVNDIKENWVEEGFGDPFKSPKKTWEFIENFDGFREGGFDYFQLTYLLNKSTENAPEDILRKIPSLKEEDAKKLTHSFIEHRIKSSHLILENNLAPFITSISNLVPTRTLTKEELTELEELLNKAPESLENLVDVKTREILAFLNVTEAEAAAINPLLQEIVLTYQRTKTIPVFFEYNIEHVLTNLNELVNSILWNEDVKLALRNVLFLPIDPAENFVIAKCNAILNKLDELKFEPGDISSGLIKMLNSEIEVSKYNYILNFLEVNFNFPASSLYELLQEEHVLSVEIKNLHIKPEFEEFEHLKSSLKIFHKISTLFGNLSDLNTSFTPVYQLIKSNLQKPEKELLIAPKAIETISVCNHIFKLYPQLNPKEILLVLTAKTGVNDTVLKYEFDDLNRFFEWDLILEEAEGIAVSDYSTVEKPLDGFLKLHRLVQLIKKVQLPKAVLTVEILNNASLQQLESQLKTNYSKQQWLDQAKNVYGPVRENLRDALVSHLLHTNTKGLRSEEDLYKHFLLDTQMSACMMTSRLLQAILSLQLFVQRCLMNLEPNIKTSNNEDWKQWEWMNRYRVWEANRKVFAYPENWIEPELRDDKSPFFQELESELMQNEMTSDLGETALRNYLQKLEGVSNLEIMAMCRAGENEDASKDSYYIFGRTYGLPQQLYFRKYVLSRSWTAWEKVEVDVEGDHLVPVVHQGKLHLFWPIFKEKAMKQTQTVPEAGTDIPADLMYWEIQMAWSVYANGKWGAKKLSQGTIVESPSLEENLQFFKNQNLSPIVRKQRLSCVFNEEKLFLRSYAFKQHNIIHLVELIFDSYIELHLSEQQMLESLNDVANRFDYSSKLDLTSEQSYEVKQIKLVGISTYDHQTIGIVKYSILFEVSTKTNLAYTEIYCAKFDGYKLVEEKLDNTYNRINPIFANNKILLPDKRDQSFKDVSFSNVKRAFTSILNDNSQIIISQEKLFYALKGHIDTELSYLNGDLESPLIYQDNVNSFFIRSNENQLIIESLNDFEFPDYHTLFNKNSFGNNTDYVSLSSDTSLDRYDFNETFVDTSQLIAINQFISNYSFSSYNWEIFFHIPMYIAGQLSKNNRYEEAQKWYHTIFNPTTNSEEETAVRYWIFKPFRETYETNAAGRPLNIVEILMLLQEVDNSENPDDYITNTTLEVQRQIEDWRDNPFEPHRIARVRIGAYMKNVVMKYIDNLIAWGDELFRQDTMESITEATQIYMLAWEILGGKPEKIPSTDSKDLSYEELQKDGGLDEFSNKLVELEEKIQVTIIRQQEAIGSNRNGIIRVNAGFGLEVQEPWNKIGTKGTKKWIETQSIQLTSLYFCIPENEKLGGYWSTVSDRFFKLRNCMNIDGIVRQLPLYQPTINPALLVRANAMGLNLADALSDMNTSLPHYRFQFMLQKAMEYTQEVKSLSSAFLGALQSKDAEEFSLLRSRHELTMLDNMRQIRIENIRLAREAVNSIELSKQMTENRLDYLKSRVKMTPEEKRSFYLKEDNFNLSMASIGLRELATVLANYPSSLIGVFITGIETGDFHNSLLSAASAMDMATQVNNHLISSSLERSSINLRWEEWKHQEQQTKIDLKRIEKELLSAEIRLALAEKEAENHELQIEQSQEQLDYMKSKFTNAQLYNWMSTELSKLYRSSFEMAYQLAKKAEKAWQHELGMNDQFVKYGHWDSLYKGLLSGEKLMNDLRRMETAYMDKNEREYELIKHVSLAQLDPFALLMLRETGTCAFEIPELLYDMDYPGQYFRRLKSVSISIPCITGPYTSVNAKLTLEKSRYRKNTHLSPDYFDKMNDFANPADDSRFVYSHQTPQSIATSNAQNDSGVFELNFRDERYLPFEGEGAISSWKLELPQEVKQFNHATISDVILHIKYTAKEGGSILRTAANKSLVEQIGLIEQHFEKTGLNSAVNLKQDFPNEWHQLKNKGNVRLTLGKSRLPYLAQGIYTSCFLKVHFLLKAKNDPTNIVAIDGVNLTLIKNNDLKFYEGVSMAIEEDQEFELTATPGQELEELVMIINYKVKK